MFWIVWVGIGAFLAVLLSVSWWYDRDARRRGAVPRSGADMSRDRWRQERDIETEVSQVNNRAMTPKGQDAMRDAWRGKNQG